MAGLSTGAPIVQVYHEKSRILPDVSRVLACLYEKGVEFNPHMTSYKSLLKLQASTHAPVPFYDGPTFLEESREICRHIAEKYEHHGYPFLLGKDALERASVEQWLHNEEHAFNPPSRALFCHLAFPPDKDDNVDDIDIHKRKLEEVLEVYEQRLSDSEFLAGNMFTLADLVHLPNSHYITAASEFVYLYDSRKNVRRWWDAISKRGSWQKVLMYMKKVEEQNKQDELKEQQQQKNHPKTPGYPLQIHSTKHTTIEAWTVLMHPAGTVSSSPIAPQTEKPLPIDIPDEPLVSSSQSTPTDHETSVAKSKETPFQEKPPQKSPIPVQSTIAPATSPITSEKSPIVGAARFSTKDTSSPEPGAGYGGGQDTNKQLRDPGSIARQTAAQSTFGESKAADSMISSEGSSDAFQFPHPRHDLDAARHITAPFQKRYPLTEDTTKQTKDIISSPWQMADQETEDTENTTKETKIPDSSSSLVQPLYFQRAEAPSEKHETTEGLVREKETTEDHHGATSPIHKRHANIKDMAGQYRDVAFKPKKMISQDDGDALKETKFRDPSLLREQPSDTRQAATTTDEETNQDGLNMALPSKRTQTIYPSVTASRTRYPITKDPSKQPRGTPSTPRHKAAQDEHDTSERSTISDEVASSEQPLNARRAPISPRRQEVEDSPREITSFQKRDPYVEDMQVADTVSQQIPSSGVKDTFEETKIADSSTTSAKHMYTQQSALPPRRQVEVQHAQEKGRQSEVTSPEPHKMVSRGARDTHGEGKTGTPGEQSSEHLQAIPQPRPAAAEDAHGATGERIQFPDILDTTMKSRGTFEETQDAGPTLPRARPLGAQDAPESETPTADHQRMDVSTQLQSDAQDTFLQSKLPAADQKGLGSLTMQERDSKDLHATLSEEKPVSSERPREMIKKTQSTAPKAHPIDSQGSIKVEKVPFLYEKKPLFAHDNQDQAQIIPSGGKGDDSTPEREEASDAPYNDEKLSAAAPAREKSRNDFNAEESHKKDTTDDQKVASSLRSEEPISQLQPPSGPSQDADPHGDLSSKLSTIEQWQRASTPLNDITTNSREETGMPTLDQKPTPRSQQGFRIGHGANQMAKEPGVEAPILPIEPETSGVQSASPSFPEAATTDHAFVDDKFAKQSIIDERLGEPKQMQAPITDARPASPPTKRKTPDGLETDDFEHVGSSDGQISDAVKATPLGPATIREDSHDASIGEKTTKYGASGDQLVTGPLDEQAQPPALTHEAKEPIVGRRTSKEPRLRGSSQAEVAHAERKSTLTDQKPAHSAQPLSPVEPVNIDSNDYEADHTSAPQMTFRQQARPSAPIIRGVPTSDRQSVTRKIQEVTPDYHHTEDSGKPLVPSQEDQMSHASQAIPPQEDTKYSPSARDSPKSDIQTPSAQVHEVAHNDQKVVSPLRSKEPTSQVQPPSGPSQDEDPHGDLSSQLSTIKQWQRASAPLNDMTTSSRDAVDIPTIDQKSTPLSQQGPRSGHGANQMAKESGEQRVGTPILRIELETSGVQSTSPSFPEAATTDHAIIDDEFAKQSIMDERLEEPKQMQAPITDARPASPPTKRKTPNDPETGDLEVAGSSEGQILDAARATPPGPTTIREDSHDAAIDEKTTKYDASGDQLVTGPLHEQARPHAPTHEATKPIGGRRTSKEPQLRGSSQAEVVDAERKSILADQKPARAAQPLSPVVPVNIDSNGNETDDTVALQMTFRQQAIPSTPIIKAIPTSDSQSVKRKIQEVTPDYGRTEDSGQVHEVSRDESSEKQGSHVGSTFGPNELGPIEKKFVPSDQGLGHSADDLSSADPRKEYPVAPTVKQIKALPGIIGQQGTPETREVPSSGDALDTTSEDALDTISTNVDVHPTASTKAPRRSFSVQGAEPTSSAQAPPFHVAHDSLHTGTTPDDALGNAVSMKQSASPDAQHGIAPGNTTDEVTPAEHKFVPSDQDSVHSKQSPPSAVQRNEVIGDSTPETQQIFSMGPRKGDVATPDEAKGTRTPLDQHEMLSAPLRSVPPSSDTQRPSEKAREHIPADDLGEAASKPPSDIREVRQPTVVPASAAAAHHGAATDEEALDKQKSVPSGQDSVHSTQPPSSSEQRNGRIGDSASSTQWISSTKPNKGDVVASTPDQAKDSEITLRGQDILPPARSVSPSSDIQRPSGKAHDVPANDLGEAKPILQASAPDTQDETARDEAAPDEKKFAPPEPTSSTEPRNEEIRDSAPSTQLISSSEKMKENATIGAPDQGKDLQTTLDQQGIPSKPVKSPSPSSDTHRPSKKAREDAPADDLGEAASKPSALVREVRPSTVPRSAPVTQYGAARDEALDKQKFVPSDQDSVLSALLRNGEIGDPAPSTQQISSTRPRKGDAAPSTPEQAKDTQITPGRQDILPPVTLESPSSDTQRPSGKVHEDVPADDDLREAEPILQASALDTQDEKKIVPSEPTLSTEPRNKEIRDSAPSAQLISSTGTRNEVAIIAAPDQNKDLQTTLDQQDILSAPVRSASPSSDTQHPSEKAQEDVLADDLREAASKSLALVREVRPPTVVPASGPATLHGAAPDETAYDEQKIVSSGQDSAQSVQPSFSSEQTKEDTIVTAADQTEDLQTIIHGQNITPSTDTTKTPLPGEEQVPLGRDEGHAAEPYRAAVDEKTATSPSSKAYSSESGSDLTQAHTDVHPSIGEGPTETSFPEHGLQTQPPLATQDISLGASNKAKSAGQEAKAPIASASETQPGSTQPQDEAAPVEQNFVVSDSAHASKSPSTAEPRKGETYVFGPADQTNLPLAILGNQDTRQTPDAREALSKSQESSRDDDGISNVADPLVSQEQASRAEHASEGPTEKGRSATVDEKTTLPPSQAQTSNTGPDSTLATGDAHLTNAEMPTTSSLQNQEAQPLAATQAPTNQAPPSSSQNVHADPLENIETPRQPSKAPPAPVTSSATYSDTPNGEPGTATFQTPQEASFDLSGGEKTTTTQGDQVNPLLNGDLSTSQPVRPSESAGFKGTNSEWKLEGASTYEKSKAQHQTDHYEIPSSKDNNKEANEAIRSDLWPKENMESSGESEHQEQADQAVVQSPDGNVKEQTKTRDTETGALEERDPQENTNQTNSEVSRMEALDSSGKQTSGVQLRGENRKDASNSADDAPEDIQTRRNSEDNLTSYEEANKVQQQSEGKTQGGETEAPLSDTVQQNGRGLPENSYQNNSSQSQAEVSDKSGEKFSPGIQNENKSSSGLDSPTDGTKSGDAEDKSGESQ